MSSNQPNILQPQLMKDDDYPQARVPFSVMAKPIGPVCNLDCSYCYYVKKKELYDGESRTTTMREDHLENYVRDYIRSNPAPVVAFSWQGGEPTLVGIDWFRKAVAFQKKYSDPAKKIENNFQTNGMLLTDEWCTFLREENFLVGLSIDGPEEIHDAYRVDRGQKPTFAKVMKGLDFLRRNRVEYNTLTTVNRRNQQAGKQVYDFLVKEAGSRHLQFIPIVERQLADGSDAGAPALDRFETRAVNLNPENVSPQGYGRFLCEIYDRWIVKDVGRIFVLAFEQVLSRMVRGHSGICVHEETCGRAVVLERDGGLYSCDHFVYPEFRLGSLDSQSLAVLMDSPRQTRFGDDKRDKLPRQCLACPVLKFCNGGCPKHRFTASSDGQPGMNYLCPSFFTFFTHVRPGLTEMADLIRAGRNPALVMKRGR